MLKWNVFRYDVNKKEIYPFNVFKHYGFRSKILELLEKDISKEDFELEVMSEAMYDFWSKCEYEVCICDWMFGNGAIKIDVYKQLQMNEDAFIEYLWSFKDKKLPSD